MSLKYRIRLSNERVIGPFTSEEIGELFLKDHITGDEVVQQFPIGDWKPFSSFGNLVSLIAKIRKENATQTKTSKTAKTDISTVAPEITQSGLKTFKEFKFDKNISIDVDYDELEKKYRIEKENQEAIQSSEPTPAQEDEKTRVVKRSRPEPEIEKTVVIPSKANRPTKESTETKQRKIIEQQQLSEVAAQEKEQEPKEPSMEELVNEKTEFLNLAQVLPSINAQLSVSEVELDRQKKIEENNERFKLKELQRIEEEQEESDDSEEGDENYDPNDLQPEPGKEESVVPKKAKKKKKKGMSIIVALAFLGIFYVLLSPEEKAAPTGPLFLEVQFPITQEYEDRAGAAVALGQGRDLYAKGTYKAQALATKSYLISLQKMFSNNEALGELILTYSELMEETKDPKIAANTIYKLIQLAETKMLTDLNVVTGTALFYRNIGKYLTGINLVRNYFRAKNPASSKLLAYYLSLLIKAGDFVEARKTYTKLKDIPKKPVEAYLYLAEFLEVDNLNPEARAIIDEGLKYYPGSVQLLLKKADYLFKDQQFSKYEEILKVIKQKNADNAPTLTAKFYYHMGLLSASKKLNNEAISFFKQSLDIKETEELRGMLSSLEIGNDKFTQTMVLESKVLDLINKAREELKNNNLETAFTFAIEAIDAYPDYIPAILLHTELQLKRGLFESAIITLQRAINENTQNNTLKKNLIYAYMRAYKFDEAQKQLVDLSQTKYALSSDYAVMSGEYYLAKNNFHLALRWFNEALNRNPLDDLAMFQIAKIYLRNKKFNEAKRWLARALLLDPKNAEYLATQAEIIFEQDNTDTAIGYLRDTISEVGEDPRLLSAITTFYYKSGQHKEFNSYYKRMQELPKKDEAFYEFLIYAAKLEEKSEDYINYSRELLKLNPGNLRVRMNLGEFFLNQKRYPEAMAEFEEVRAKLSSYPKVHYMLARVYIALNDLAKAKEMANKELELNSGLESAHFIAGEIARLEKDYREAITKYEKAISINPRSFDALMAMAWIRLAQNYASEAIELYNRALKEDRNNPEVHKQMAMAYKAAGQRAMAREKFEDYLKLSPGAPDREQIEAQIRNLQ